MHDARTHTRMRLFVGVCVCVCERGGLMHTRGRCCGTRLDRYVPETGLYTFPHVVVVVVVARTNEGQSEVGRIARGELGRLHTHQHTLLIHIYVQNAEAQERGFKHIIISKREKNFF